MTITINLSKKNEKLFRDYAKKNKISLNKLIIDTVKEKIEDEYDIAIANQAYEEYLKDGQKSRPIQELWDELDEHKLILEGLKDLKDNNLHDGEKVIRGIEKKYLK